MRLASHIFVAEKAATIIEQQVGVTFHHKFLQLGACMPDIQPLRRIQLHGPKLVGQHFDREYNRIVFHSKKIERISFIIGILSHYIADAFCLSHNLYTVDMKKHIQYEHLLDQYKTNMILPREFNNNVEDKINILAQSDESISDYITSINTEYLATVKDLTWEQIMPIDMEQAILHSASLLSHFIFELQRIPVPAVSMA
ncbi:MAG: zinc dependent phospholipase C family protein [Epulopiscium sp.]|nr:zinc dependent phospholipase C family protein [Candidatus Epulonipiscium sp.]